MPRGDQVFRDALAQGDQRAAGSWLVTTHARDVFSLCRAMVRDATLAEDLTQDTFQKALGALSQFRGEASAKGWLMTIARHHCLDHLRRQGRSPEALGKDEPHDGDATVDDSPLPAVLLARRDALEQALGALDETSRAMIVLRFRHGLGYGELAEAYGLKQGTVRMRISRALARMREQLQPKVARRKMAAPQAAPAGPALERAYYDGKPTAPPPASPAAPPLPQAPPALPPTFGAALAGLDPELPAGLADRLLALQA